MKELYHRVGNPNSKEDIGEQGFVNAYHGSLIFKKLVIHLLEWGYGGNDLRAMFEGEQFEGLRKSDSPEEEAKKTLPVQERALKFNRHSSGECWQVHMVSTPSTFSGTSTT